MSSLHFINKCNLDIYNFEAWKGQRRPYLCWHTDPVLVWCYHTQLWELAAWHWGTMAFTYGQRSSLGTESLWRELKMNPRGEAGGVPPLIQSNITASCWGQWYSTSDFVQIYNPHAFKSALPNGHSKTI